VPPVSLNAPLREHLKSVKAVHERDFAEILLPPTFPDTPTAREATARMYTHIEGSDWELGELLRKLEGDGIAENTYVFHWSDHGPLPRGKRWPYDSGIHMPLIRRVR
jgi:arylsulfatase A-like enzyme